MYRFTLMFLTVILPPLAAALPPVRTMRVPDGGLQPQLAVDDRGALHLVYFKGEPLNGNLFYVRSDDDAKSWSPPLRVNSQDGSAVATGTIRGAQVAIGRDARVHVAWNGSGRAAPKGPNGENPMLYARMNDGAFDAQRNLIARYYGLDGGGSVAADRDGNVYVSWHAPEKIGTGEANRRVWVAKSSDDGKTFAPERLALADQKGACGCCGMRLFADSRGAVYGLYRSATEAIHRDIYLFRSDDHGNQFHASRIAPLNIATCVMSSSSITETNGRTLAAWETKGQVFWSSISPTGASVAGVMPAPGSGINRKYPVLAANADGQLLIAWSEGTSWNKGGSIAWQIFDAKGQPIANASGTAPGLPTWSLPAAFANRDGGFTILY